ncbi:hypothetical protein NL676_035624 [Syzygium grande]|nr:hypothetical protein NL676_035624 [Syzygium grande]
MWAEVMTLEKKSNTVLEIAVMAAQDQFVENLAECWPPEFHVDILESALKNAASRGRIRMVKALVKKVDAASDSVRHALNKASSHAPMQKEVIWFLARHTTSVPMYSTMSNLIMAAHLAPRYDGSMTSKNNEKIKLLKDLAKMESYFRSGARLSFLEKCIYKCIPLCLVDASFDNPKDTKMAQVSSALKRFKISLWNLATKPAPFIKRIGESKLRHKYSLEFANQALPKEETSPEILKLTSETILEAASHGISEIVELCLKRFPELMWDKEFANKLNQEAINGRQVELFRLLANANLGYGGLMKKGLMKDVIEWTPRCVSLDVSGAAFLMQRELQWYKVMEDRTKPSMKSLKLLPCPLNNESGKSEKRTYWEAFVEQRRDLLKEARQWMKDTSSSCSVVATLIITIAFAAAFTVPGGNDGNTGIPIFLKKSSFMVFAVADALALFSSVTATLVFLAILNSRCAIEDFLHSLPFKMIVGLTFLFLSLGFMLVAFGCALTMVLNERLKWIDIPIYLLVALPIVLFAMLQLPLYYGMVVSTFWPRLYRPKKLRK